MSVQDVEERIDQTTQRLSEALAKQLLATQELAEAKVTSSELEDELQARYECIGAEVRSLRDELQELKLSACMERAREALR